MGILSALGALFRRKRPAATTPSYPPGPPNGQPVSAIELQWAGLKAYVAHCERERLDLGKLHRDDAVGFFLRRQAIQEAAQAGIPLERAARENGFLSAAHWQGVERYFEARYSRLVAEPNGARTIRYVDEFHRAQLLATEQRAQAARTAAAKKLLEPIQGVTLERFAEISATLVVALGAMGGASRSELSSVLAQYNIGTAAFGRTRRGWMERIESDPSGHLKTIYAGAFRTARERLMANASSGVMARPEEDILPAATIRKTWVDVG